MLRGAVARGGFARSIDLDVVSKQCVQNFTIDEVGYTRVITASESR
jgi:hypothetical protein